MTKMEITSEIVKNVALNNVIEPASKREYKKRNLGDLNLIDNFLFGMLMSDERFQNEAAEIILEILFERPVKVKTVLAERVVYPADTNLRGVRLDALIEVEGMGALPRSFIDLEPENKMREKKMLPQRVRYYHSIIDNTYFKSGQEFEELPKVWVVFITSFDPFENNCMVYTNRSLCEEDPKMKYDDGARSIFYNVKGEAGNTSRQLVELLEYMADTTPEKACNEKLARIQSFVDELKKDPKVKEAYRMFNDYIMSERREAAEEANKRADEERKKADEERKKAEAAEKRTEVERKKAAAAEKRAQESNSILENLIRNLRTSGMTDEELAKLMASGSAI